MISLGKGESDESSILEESSPLHTDQYRCFGTICLALVMISNSVQAWGSLNTTRCGRKRHDPLFYDYGVSKRGLIREPSLLPHHMTLWVISDMRLGGALPSHAKVIGHSTNLMSGWPRLHALITFPRHVSPSCDRFRVACDFVAGLLEIPVTKPFFTKPFLEENWSKGYACISGWNEVGERSMSCQSLYTGSPTT